MLGEVVDNGVLDGLEALLRSHAADRGVVVVRRFQVVAALVLVAVAVIVRIE
jgi:hypothetical protein